MWSPEIRAFAENVSYVDDSMTQTAVFPEGLLAPLGDALLQPIKGKTNRQMKQLWRMSRKPI